MCLLSMSFLSCLLLGFFDLEVILFSCYFVLSNLYYLPWNSKFDSWFGWNALGCCFYMGCNKVFIFVIRSLFSRYLLKSIKLVSYCYHVSLLVSEDQSYCEALSIYVVFPRRCERIFTCDRNTPSKEKNASQFKALFIPLLFMNL